MFDSNLLRRVDWQLLIPVGILSVVSLVTLFSISPAFFRNQLLFTGIAIVCFVIFSHTDLKVFRFFKGPMYLAVLVSLIILLVIGFSARGSVRWLGIGGYGIQFS